MKEAIVVDDLWRSYDTSIGILRKQKKTVDALNGISFAVKQGEIFGLLGPNGAGKTTTIKILTTLLTPTKGTAHVLGYPTVGAENQLRSRINFIFGGERSLYWRLSALDNLRYFSDLYRIDPRIQRKRIPELLKLVGLEERQHHRVETFSKGMKQRLQIARGLINDPEVLFLDEPTIGLDPTGAMELRTIVRNLSQAGKTILLTTHYMQEADDLCHRIGLISGGKLVGLDTPGNLKRQANKATLEEVYIEKVGGEHAS